MNHKRAFLISLSFHVGLFALLLSGLDFSSFRQPKPPVFIEAHAIYKKIKQKENLPRKPRAEALAEQKKPDEKNKEKELSKNDKKSEQPAPKKPEEIADIGQKIVDKKKKPNDLKPSDYSKALKALSSSFANDIASELPIEEPEGEVVADETYFDQIYRLIKDSFIVPPHINGPQGRDLQTVIKLFLASDGSILDITLVSSSGDDHFDKAVVEGTRRVDFGLVPPTLQNMVRERGIVVELCPFTCKEHNG